MKKIIVTLFVLFGLGGIALAQDYKQLKETIDVKSRNILLTEFTVSPQKPPEPALKYKLTWGFDQRVKNNAAIKLNFAMRELSQLQYRLAVKASGELERDYQSVLENPTVIAEKKTEYDSFLKEVAAQWNQSADADFRERATTIEYQVSAFRTFCSFPRDQFPLEKAKQFTDQFFSTYRHLEAASKCDYSDWERNIRGNRNPIAILLPEIQEVRDLARGLQVKCRVEIAEKRYDDAINTIRVGMCLARHCGEEPILVSQLVGISIKGIMDSCLQELIQQPDAPNLYWALTELPRPMFSFRSGMEVEMDTLRLMLPLLAKAMDEPDTMTDTDWKELHQSACQAIQQLGFSGVRPVRFSGVRPDYLDSAGAIFGLVTYPKAKQWLIEQGQAPEEVEKMTVTKVIGLYSVFQFQVIRDDILKQMELPIGQKNDSSQLLTPHKELTPLYLLTCYLFPAAQNCHIAHVRTLAETDRLRIIEAIRLYAAETGKLPESLDEIKSVPIPPCDPFSGKPFVYKCSEGTATLEFDTGIQLYRSIIRLRK